MGVELIDMFT